MLLTSRSRSARSARPSLRPSPQPRLLPTLVVVVVTALALPPTTSSADESPRVSPARGAAADPGDRPTVAGLPRVEHAYRFVSHPDFLNQDVGDVTGLATYDGGPNGTNPTYEKSLVHVLDQIQAEDPAAFLVAGDLVEGSWGMDRTDSGTFGPLGTEKQKRAAVRRAASVYYGDWMKRARRHDLTVYPALGDHEIGDNPWRLPAGHRDHDWTEFKRRNLGLWKQQFSQRVLGAVRGKHPGLAEVGGTSHPDGQASGTAYAVRLDRRMLLVSLDEFRRTADGRDVSVSLDSQQLRWLTSVLKQARRLGVPWVVVQGHVPVLGPVRHRFSSQLSFEGGRSSDLWRLMSRYGVDVYLAGEVHDHTVIRRDGITQMTHGGLFYRGESSYVVGQVTGRRLYLETHYLDGRPKWSGHKLWSVEGGYGPKKVVYDQPSRVVGTYVLARRTKGGPHAGNKVVQKTGISGAAYRP